MVSKYDQIANFDCTREYLMLEVSGEKEKEGEIRLFQLSNHAGGISGQPITNPVCAIPAAVANI